MTILQSQEEIQISSLFSPMRESNFRGSGSVDACYYHVIWSRERDEYLDLDNTEPNDYQRCTSGEVLSTNYGGNGHGYPQP